MQFTEAKLGRTFVLRLHDGDHLPDVLEKFAEEQNIAGALCFFVGGAKDGSKVVVGPKDAKSEAFPVEPVITLLAGVSEVAGIGTLFRNEEGEAKLHMHASFGRGEKAVTGCVRMGVDVWRIGEVVVLELAGTEARRVVDKETGFELLETS
jgi:uncharacterized protein